MNCSFLRLLESGRDNQTVGWRADVPVSHAELTARCSQWRDALAALPGTDFALHIDDAIEFAAALFGAWHAGKTVWLAADMQPATIEAMRGNVDGFAGDFPDTCASLRGVQVDGPPDTRTPWSVLGADTLRTALVVHTSGSTGSPQAIPKTFGQLDSEVSVLEQLFGAQLGDAAVLSTVSHHHIYGLLFRVLWPLAAGRALHATNLHYPEQLAQYSAPTILIASPAHLKRLSGHVQWAQGRAVFCSGGVLPVDAALQCRAVLGHVPIEVYGSSESGGIAWRQRDDAAKDAWQAMPDVSWRVGNGQIEVRSPHCGNADWLPMADRVEAIDADRFRLLGRADRIVKIEEKRVSLDGLERALLASALVTDARLLVLDGSGQTREQLAAVLVLSPEGHRQLQVLGKVAFHRVLRAQLRHVAVDVALPRRWRHVDQLPVDAQGKTTHALLQNLFDGQRVLPSEHAITPDWHVQRTWQDGALQCAELQIVWPARLDYFKGHFPVAPVLPGVAQVEWAIRLGRKIFDAHGTFCGMRALKFQHVLRPDQPTRLRLQYDAQKGVLGFSMDGPGHQYSSGRILLDVGSAND